MHLGAYGEIAQECWLAIPEHYPHVDLNAFVVMPNHVHGILVLGDDTAEFPHMSAQERFGKPVPGSLPTIVRTYKAGVARRINVLRSTPGVPIWQRNYDEHIIRDAASLDRIRSYVAANPSRWAGDRL
jgi:REP element-mobilizing transposase RayT